MLLPKITVITPSFNQGHFLRQTILSVLEQEYTNLEYMIFDGGSSDNSVEIIKEYEGKLKFWVSEKDKGQSHAINKGITRATGDIIGWLNSDDYLEKGALMSIAKNFNQPDVNCVIGKIAYFNNSGHLWNSNQVVYKPAEKTLGAGVVPQPAMYFAKSCYDKVGLLNERLHFCFDSEWYMRYLMHYGIEGIKEIADLLVHFRFHEHSKSMNNSYQFRQERNSIFFDIANQHHQHKIKNILNQLYTVDKDYHFDQPKLKNGLSVNKALNYFVMQIGNEYYAANDKKNAKLCFDIVNEKLLEPADQRLFTKIRTRNRYLPLGVLKILRKYRP